MAEALITDPTLSKEESYKQLLPQVAALVEGEPNNLANRANLCAVLKEAFNFLWVGFYNVDGEELVLGNFQGPLACTRIARGKGVCGSAWDRNEAIIVEDVELFPGHIACSSLSRSEIVIPVRDKNGSLIAVFDVDDEALGRFDEIDLKYMNKMLDLI